MRGNNLIVFVCYLLIVLITFIISFVYGYERVQSYAFGTLGPAIGFVIGSLLRERKKIINTKKFKIDLFTLLSIALVGSFLISAFFERGDLKAISVIVLNLVMLFVFILRNAKNIKL